MATNNQDITVRLRLDSQNLQRDYDKAVQKLTKGVAANVKVTNGTLKQASVTGNSAFSGMTRAEANKAHLDTLKTLQGILGAVKAGNTIGAISGVVNSYNKANNRNSRTSNTRNSINQAVSTNEGIDTDASEEFLLGFLTELNSIKRIRNFTNGIASNLRTIGNTDFSGIEDYLRVFRDQVNRVTGFQDNLADTIDRTATVRDINFKQIGDLLKAFKAATREVNKTTKSISKTIEGLDLTPLDTTQLNTFLVEFNGSLDRIQESALAMSTNIDSTNSKVLELTSTIRSQMASLKASQGILKKLISSKPLEAVDFTGLFDINNTIKNELGRVNDTFEAIQDTVTNNQVKIANLSAFENTVKSFKAQMTRIKAVQFKLSNIVNDLNIPPVDLTKITELSTGLKTELDKVKDVFDNIQTIVNDSEIKVANLSKLEEVTKVFKSQITRVKAVQFKLNKLAGDVALTPVDLTKIVELTEGLQSELEKVGNTFDTLQDVVSNSAIKVADLSTLEDTIKLFKGQTTRIKAVQYKLNKVASDIELVPVDLTGLNSLADTLRSELDNVTAVFDTIQKTVNASEIKVADLGKLEEVNKVFKSQITRVKAVQFKLDKLAKDVDIQTVDLSLITTLSDSLSNQLENISSAFETIQSTIDSSQVKVADLTNLEATIKIFKGQATRLKAVQFKLDKLVKDTKLEPVELSPLLALSETIQSELSNVGNVFATIQEAVDSSAIKIADLSKLEETNKIFKSQITRLKAVQFKLNKLATDSQINPVDLSSLQSITNTLTTQLDVVKTVFDDIQSAVDSSAIKVVDLSKLEEVNKVFKSQITRVKAVQFKLNKLANDSQITPVDLSSLRTIADTLRAEIDVVKEVSSNIQSTVENSQTKIADFSKLEETVKLFKSQITRVKAIQFKLNKLANDTDFSKVDLSGLIELSSILKSELANISDVFASIQSAVDSSNIKITDLSKLEDVNKVFKSQITRVKAIQFKLNKLANDAQITPVDPSNLMALKDALSSELENVSKIFDDIQGVVDSSSIRLADLTPLEGTIKIFKGQVTRLKAVQYKLDSLSKDAVVQTIDTSKITALASNLKAELASITDVFDSIKNTVDGTAIQITDLSVFEETVTQFKSQTARLSAIQTKLDKLANDLTVKTTDLSKVDDFVATFQEQTERVATAQERLNTFIDSIDLSNINQTQKLDALVSVYTDSISNVNEVLERITASTESIKNSDAISSFNLLGKQITAFRTEINKIAKIRKEIKSSLDLVQTIDSTSEIEVVSQFLDGFSNEIGKLGETRGLIEEAINKINDNGTVAEFQKVYNVIASFKTNIEGIASVTRQIESVVGLAESPELSKLAQGFTKVSDSLLATRNSLEDILSAVASSTQEINIKELANKVKAFKSELTRVMAVRVTLAKLVSNLKVTQKMDLTSVIDSVKQIASQVNRLKEIDTALAEIGAISIQSNSQIESLVSALQAFKAEINKLDNISLTKELVVLEGIKSRFASLDIDSANIDLSGLEQYFAAFQGNVNKINQFNQDITQVKQSLEAIDTDLSFLDTISSRVDALDSRISAVIVNINQSLADVPDFQETSSVRMNKAIKMMSKAMFSLSGANKELHRLTQGIEGKYKQIDTNPLYNFIQTFNQDIQAMLGAHSQLRKSLDGASDLPKLSQEQVQEDFNPIAHQAFMGKLRNIEAVYAKRDDKDNPLGTPNLDKLKKSDPEAYYKSLLTKGAMFEKTIRNLNVGITSSNKEIADFSQTLKTKFARTLGSINDRIAKEYKGDKADAPRFNSDSKREFQSKFELANSSPLGKDFVDGYNLTIRAGDKEAVDAGYTLAEAAINGLQTGQDSASPSKKTMKLGQDFIAGYANAIEQGKKQVNQKGNALAKEGIAGIKKGQNSNSPSLETFAKGVDFVKGYANAIVAKAKEAYNAAKKLAASAVSGLKDGRKNEDIFSQTYDIGRFNRMEGKNPPSPPPRRKERGGALVHVPGQRGVHIPDTGNEGDGGTKSFLDSLIDAAEQRVKGLSKLLDSMLDVELSNRAKKVKNVMLGLLPLAGAIAFRGQISKAIGELVRFNLEIESVRNKLKATSSDISQGSLFTDLSKDANAAGQSVLDYGNTLSSLRAATKGKIASPDKLTADISQGLAKRGVGGEQASRALVGIQQMASKGVVSMEELRQQLGEALPGAMVIAAESMGMTEKQFNKMVTSGQIMSSDFLPKFAKALNAVSGDTNRLSFTMAAFQNNVGKFKERVVDVEAFKITFAGLNAVMAGLAAIAPAIGLFFGTLLVSSLVLAVKGLISVIKYSALARTSLLAFSSVGIGLAGITLAISAFGTATNQSSSSIRKLANEMENLGRQEKKVGDGFGEKTKRFLKSGFGVENLGLNKREREIGSRYSGGGFLEDIDTRLSLRAANKALEGLQKGLAATEKQMISLDKASSKVSLDAFAKKNNSVIEEIESKRYKANNAEFFGVSTNQAAALQQEAQLLEDKLSLEIDTNFRITDRRTAISNIEAQISEIEQEIEAGGDEKTLIPIKAKLEASKTQIKDELANIEAQLTAYKPSIDLFIKSDSSQAALTSKVSLLNTQMEADLYKQMLADGTSSRAAEIKLRKLAIDSRKEELALTRETIALQEKSVDSLSGNQIGILTAALGSSVDGANIENVNSAKAKFAQSEALGNKIDPIVLEALNTLESKLGNSQKVKELEKEQVREQFELQKSIRDLKTEIRGLQLEAANKSLEFKRIAVENSRYRVDRVNPVKFQAQDAARQLELVINSQKLAFAQSIESLQDFNYGIVSATRDLATKIASVSRDIQIATIGGVNSFLSAANLTDMFGFDKFRDLLGKAIGNIQADNTNSLIREKSDIERQFAIDVRGQKRAQDALNTDVRGQQYDNNRRLEELRLAKERTLQDNALDIEQMKLRVLEAQKAKDDTNLSIKGANASAKEYGISERASLVTAIVPELDLTDLNKTAAELANFYDEVINKTLATNSALANIANEGNAEYNRQLAEGTRLQKERLNLKDAEINQAKELRANNDALLAKELDGAAVGVISELGNKARETRNDLFSIQDAVNGLLLGTGLNSDLNTQLTSIGNKKLNEVMSQISQFTNSRNKLMELEKATTYDSAGVAGFNGFLASTKDLAPELRAKFTEKANLIASSGEYKELKALIDEAIDAYNKGIDTLDSNKETIAQSAVDQFSRKFTRRSETNEFASQQASLDSNFKLDDDKRASLQAQLDYFKEQARIQNEMQDLIDSGEDINSVKKYGQELNRLNDINLAKIQHQLKMTTKMLMMAEQPLNDMFNGIGESFGKALGGAIDPSVYQEKANEINAQLGEDIVALQEKYEGDPAGMNEAVERLQMINDTKLDGIRTEFSLLNGVITSLKDAVVDFASTLAKALIAKGVQKLIGAAIGVPTFSDGGTVGVFANGGTVGCYSGGGTIGVAKAMTREKQLSGKKPIPIIAHEGEEILTTLNGDAQFFKKLQVSGAWDSLKKQGRIEGFATGGTVGSPWISTGSSTIGQNNNFNKNIMVNTNYNIKATDVNSFQRSKSQLEYRTNARLNEASARR